VGHTVSAFYSELIMNSEFVFAKVVAVVTLAVAATALSSCATQNPPLWDDPVPPLAANYTVKITPDTKYVNVKLDDVVAFDIGGRTFAWSFNDPNYWPVDLSKVVPPGVLDHRVIVYISPFRRYFGRDDT
jgi:hypothetical protein